MELVNVVQQPLQHGRLRPPVTHHIAGVSSLKQSEIKLYAVADGARKQFGDHKQEKQTYFVDVFFRRR